MCGEATQRACSCLCLLPPSPAALLCRVCPTASSHPLAVPYRPRRAFAPLADAGVLEIVYGGGDVGARLCSHAGIASVHLTGSAATYNAIVWQGRPKHGDPPFAKPVGAELGCGRGERGAGRSGCSAALVASRPGRLPCRVHSTRCPGPSLRALTSLPPLAA